MRATVILFLFAMFGTSQAQSPDESVVTINPTQLVSPQWREVSLAAINRAAALYGWSDSQKDTAARDLAHFAMINVYQYTGRKMYLAVDGTLVEDKHEPFFKSHECSK